MGVHLSDSPASATAHPPPLATVPLLALHLIPGAVFTVCLLFASRFFVRHGLTAYLAELVLIPVCLAPMLVGVMLSSARRSGPGLSLGRAIAYRKPGTLGDYVTWPILLFLLWGLCSLAIVPLTGAIEGAIAGWFPAQLTTGAMVAGVASAPPGERLATLLVAVLFSGLLAPLVEEAYFRGFLLPRMAHLGPAAPVVNAFLFGVYHFFSPWALPAVFVAFVPVAFVVQAKKNFRIGVVVHVLFNLTGIITLFTRS